MARYYDALYGRSLLLVLWGIVVDETKVCAECGALGDYLPDEMELFTSHENQITPELKIDLGPFSGLADDGSGLNQNLTFTILENYG